MEMPSEKLFTLSLYFFKRQLQSTKVRENGRLLLSQQSGNRVENQGFARLSL